MSRRQEHMWSEESRGQQRGARGQQFKPEWTVVGVDRKGEESPEQHHNGGWEDHGGSEKPRNETARSPAQWAKRPSWKKGNQMFESPARRSEAPEWSCETRWTEAASVRQNWMRVSERIPACGT